jgi:hypothetical protein
MSYGIRRYHGVRTLRIMRANRCERERILPLACLRSEFDLIAPVARRQIDGARSEYIRKPQSRVACQARNAMRSEPEPDEGNATSPTGDVGGSMRKRLAAAASSTPTHSS